MRVRDTAHVTTDVITGATGRRTGEKRCLCCLALATWLCFPPEALTAGHGIIHQHEPHKSVQNHVRGTVICVCERERGRIDCCGRYHQQEMTSSTIGLPIFSATFSARQGRFFFFFFPSQPPSEKTNPNRLMDASSETGLSAAVAFFCPLHIMGSEPRINEVT